MGEKVRELKRKFQKKSSVYSKGPIRVYPKEKGNGASVGKKKKDLKEGNFIRRAKVDPFS